MNQNDSRIENLILESQQSANFEPFQSFDQLDRDESTASVSRFNHDFEMVKELGQGGFGSVIKARNKLDGSYYALKRMVLDYKYPEEVKRILLEVKHLSQFHNLNIVRYYQAWTEKIPEDELKEILESEEEEEEEEQEMEDESSNKLEISNCISPIKTNKNIEANDDIQQGLVINFGDEPSKITRVHGSPKKKPEKKMEPDSSKMSSDSSSSNSGNSNSSDSSQSDSESSGFSSNDSVGNAFDIRLEDKSNSDSIIVFGANQEMDPDTCTWVQTLNKNVKDLEEGESKMDHSQMRYLYIQMECCEGETLDKIITSSKLSDDPKLFKTLITQLLEALMYVHRKGLIHRDLKPQNVFLDKDNNVKLGDFGLAKKGAVIPDADRTNITGTQPQSRFFPDTDVHSFTHSRGVGTPIYMSPEQAKGGKYDEKTDMFSLGLILFEMACSPFGTVMERKIKIMDLRENLNFPIDFEKKSGRLTKDLKKVITQLLSDEPENRPSSKDLFQKYHDSLYQDMIISNVNEYKKIIKFVFSEKNMFPTNLDHIVNPEDSNVKIANK